MKKETIHNIARSLIAGFAIYCVAYTVQGQMTSITLPTNDNTSGFEVIKNNGASVFKVDGSGKITGDASGMANAKPVISYTQGNFEYYFPANESGFEIVRSVSIDVPGPGVIWVQASGYADWESKNEDLIRGSILQSTWGDPNSGGTAQTQLFASLLLKSDYQCADSSDQYDDFSTARCFTVGSSGTYTYHLWIDTPFSTTLARICDANMVAMYFPTGGAGKAALREEEYQIQPGPGVDTPDM